MGVKYIRNGIVKMLWDAEGFYESKKVGFIGAVHIYHNDELGDLPVAFRDNRVFMILDNEAEEGERKVCSRNDLYQLFREELKTNVLIEDAYEEYYVDLGNIYGIDDQIADIYGFSKEDREDMMSRLEDLRTYWDIEECTLG